jgi:hypothetical protein
MFHGMQGQQEDSYLTAARHGLKMQQADIDRAQEFVNALNVLRQNVGAA